MKKGRYNQKSISAGDRTIIIGGMTDIWTAAEEPEIWTFEDKVGMMINPTLPIKFIDQLYLVPWDFCK